MLRSVCFLALDALRSRLGEDLPLVDGLALGFVYEGRRVPFLNWQKGIFRAAAQRGPAALGIMTSVKSPYDDEETLDGFWYAYRAGDVDQGDNRALRAAALLRVPLVYFVATRPGWYRAIYPCFITEDDAHARRVLISVGRADHDDPVEFVDALDRRYAVREARVRLHQGRFRGAVLRAYSDRCAVCRLRESRLLDAAHIDADRDATGDAVVTNGVSLCSIHHRAFDQNLIGLSPEYRVHVARRLLEDDDGPMLDLLKGSHGRELGLPRAPRERPDQARLERRFARFTQQDAAGAT